MKKFTTVILVIVLVCLVSGMVLCGIGVASGANFTELGRLIREGRYSIGWLKDDIDVDDLDLKETEETFKNADIHSMDADIDAGSLDIEDSWDDDIHVKIRSRNVKVKVSNDAGTLKIDCGSGNHWWFFGRQRCAVTLYLPEGKQWTQTDFELGAGSITSGLSQLTVRDMDISVGAGEADLPHSITVQQKASLEVDAGQLAIGKINASELKVQVSVGEIDLTADVGEKLSADCDVGELNLGLAGGMEDYNYKVDCGLGEVSLGTEKMTSLGDDRHIDHHAAKDVEIDCGVGTVSVSFEQ